MTTVQDNKVVSFHYTLTSEAGARLDSSHDRGEPMQYLHGANNIIVGLEKALEGRSAGDSFSVTVPPEEAYGVRREANVQRVSLKRLGIGAHQLRPGQVLNLQTTQGPAQVTVLKVGRFNVDVDANHPLSGQSLNFEVEVVDIRDATQDELRHGHVHGPGGHDHG